MLNFYDSLISQSCSRYRLNQLGSKAASESTVKKLNACGVSNKRLHYDVNENEFAKYANSGESVIINQIVW